MNVDVHCVLQPRRRESSRRALCWCRLQKGLARCRARCGCQRWAAGAASPQPHWLGEVVAQAVHTLHTTAQPVALVAGLLRAHNLNNHARRANRRSRRCQGKAATPMVVPPRMPPRPPMVKLQ